MKKPRAPIQTVKFNGLAAKAAKDAGVSVVGKASNLTPDAAGSLSNDDQELSMAAVKALRARFAPKKMGKTSWL